MELITSTIPELMVGSEMSVDCRNFWSDSTTDFLPSPTSTDLWAQQLLRWPPPSSFSYLLFLCFPSNVLIVPPKFSSQFNFQRLYQAAWDGDLAAIQQMNPTIEQLNTRAGHVCSLPTHFFFHEHLLISQLIFSSGMRLFSCMRPGEGTFPLLNGFSTDMGWRSTQPTAFVPVNLISSSTLLTSLIWYYPYFPIV